MDNGRILVKVYGQLTGVSREQYAALNSLIGEAIGPDGTAESVELEFDPDSRDLSLSFEGFHFPVDEFRQVLQQAPQNDVSGKLDYIDLESWRLTRTVFNVDGAKTSSASLNHVLEYSGH